MNESVSATNNNSEPREIKIDLTLPEFAGDEYKELTLPESRHEPYLVDLTSHSCQCSEWNTSRAEFPENDVRRACKHIAGIITEEPFSEGLTGLAKIWCVDSIESDEGIPVFDEIRAFDVEGVEVVLLRASDRNWVDVIGFPGYVRRERPYSLYGYDLAAGEWSYGQAPESGEQIEALIKQNFKASASGEIPAEKSQELARDSRPAVVPNKKGEQKRVFWVASILALVVAAIILVIIFRQ